jgi:seryl-tRNA synthetase
VKPSNLTLIQIILSAGVTIALGGMAYGSLASDQKSLSKKVDKDQIEIKLIRGDVNNLKTDVAVIKVQVESVDERGKRIEEAVNKILMRTPSVAPQK